MIRNFIDSIAVVSYYSLEKMLSAFALAAEQMIVFPNAVDAYDKSPFVSSGSTNILVVSRLGFAEREKNVDKLIEALPLVNARVPSATLTIIGDGPLKDELESLASKLGVLDRVTFAGFVNEEELRAAYRRAALFALPSSKEGFGIVYLEAWREGLPVVASRFGAAPEVVCDGVDGFTVDPADIVRLADAICNLLMDECLAGKFAANGLGKVKGKYSNDAFKSRLSNLVA
jgi:glycosyltransferase involved in cell wall biosynthesis